VTLAIELDEAELLVAILASVENQGNAMPDGAALVNAAKALKAFRSRLLHFYISERINRLAEKQK